MLLYQNMIIRESGKMNDALDHLGTHEHQIPDKLAVTELKGTCLMVVYHCLPYSKSVFVTSFQNDSISSKSK